MAEAVASGTRPIAMTNSRLLSSIATERPTWINGCRVRSSVQRYFGRNTMSMMSRWPVKRAQVICEAG